MNVIHCMIAEDELPSSEELIYILGKYPFINIMGVANDGVKALELASEKLPDVIFLDINMPEMSGIELAEKLKILKKDIRIIFITAYESHALKAFELGAIDYILKPFDEKRIEVTLKRILEILYNSNERPPKTNKIPAVKHGRTFLLDIDCIYFCFTENEKTYIKVKNEKYDTSCALYEMEQKTGFFRAHKSFIVNIDHIKELYPWTNGTYKIIMDDLNKSEITVSRTYVNNLKNMIGI